MPRKDKYYPDYIKMYPCLKERKDILQALRQSDRKMKYIEVDLKQERCIVDQTQQSTTLQPSRDDSYERLIYENGQEFPANEDLEALVCEKDIVDRLHHAMLQLDKQDQELISALFFDRLSERQYARKKHQHYMTVHSRKVRILAFLKKLLEK